eukprot:g18714.t1
MSAPVPPVAEKPAGAQVSQKPKPKRALLQKPTQYSVTARAEIKEQAAGHANKGAFCREVAPKYDDMSAREQKRLKAVVRRAEAANLEGREGAAAAKRIRMPGGGRKIKAPEIGEQLYDFYLNQTDRFVKVSRKMLLLQALALKKELAAKCPDMVLPVIAETWLTRWCARFSIVLRLPNVKVPLEPRVARLRDEAFYRQVWTHFHYFRCRSKTPLIISADEKPLYMCSTGSEKFLYDKGARSVPHFFNVGQSRSRFTLMTTVCSMPNIFPGGKPPIEILFRGAGKSARIRDALQKVFDELRPTFAVRVRFRKSGSYNTESFDAFVRETLVPAMKGKTAEHLAAAAVDADGDEDEGRLNYGWGAAAGRTDVQQANDVSLHYPLSRAYKEMEMQLQSSRALVRKGQDRILITRGDALAMVLKVWEKLDHSSFARSFTKIGFDPTATLDALGGGVRPMWDGLAGIRKQAEEDASSLFRRLPAASAEEVYTNIVRPLYNSLCPGSHKDIDGQDAEAAAKKEQAIEDSGAANVNSFRCEPGDELADELLMASPSAPPDPAGPVSVPSGSGDGEPLTSDELALSKAELLEKIAALGRRVGDRVIVRRTEMRKRHVASTVFEQKVAQAADNRLQVAKDLEKDLEDAGRARAEEVRRQIEADAAGLRVAALTHKFAHAADNILRSERVRKQAEEQRVLKFNASALQDFQLLHLSVANMCGGVLEEGAARCARTALARRHAKLREDPTMACAALGRKLSRDEQDAGNGRALYLCRVLNVLNQMPTPEQRRSAILKLAHSEGRTNDFGSSSSRGGGKSDSGAPLQGGKSASVPDRNGGKGKQGAKCVFAAAGGKTKGGGGKAGGPKTGPGKK